MAGSSTGPVPTPEKSRAGGHVRTTPTRRIAAVWFGMVLVLAAGTSAAGRLEEQLTEGGRVLMIRHALAPGSGDPAHFTIGDCATQRNLNDRGRDQAREIGRWLRARRVASARVYSSQCCRCLETAERLGLGPATRDPRPEAIGGTR